MLVFPEGHPELIRRVQICKFGNNGAPCPYFQNLQVTKFFETEKLQQCGKCHCILNVKWKLPAFHCPFRYW